MAEWDAARYHRISDPQLAWGRTVAARLRPVAGECILDVGCGTGRLTAEIATTPGVLVVGLDASAAMLAEAGTRTFDRPVMYVRGDTLALPFAGRFDAVFSTATFHWVRDHVRLFEAIFAALARGGRLVAQCGGRGNLQRLYGRTRTLMADPRYARLFHGWEDPWLFAGVEETQARLASAGFIDTNVELVEAPTGFDTPAVFAEFIGAVCLRHELERLPGNLREPFVAELTDMARHDDPPLTLDYWRLNIAARKPAS